MEKLRCLMLDTNHNLGSEAAAQRCRRPMLVSCRPLQDFGANLEFGKTLYSLFGIHSVFSGAAFRYPALQSDVAGSVACFTYLLFYILHILK